MLKSQHIKLTKPCECGSLTKREPILLEQRDCNFQTEIGRA